MKTTNFENLKWKEDLIYYDGPLLSIMDLNGEEWIVSWMDDDGEETKWLAFQTDKLEEFKESKISLREMYEEGAPWYCVWMNQGEFVRSEGKELLTEDELPDPNSYWDGSLRY